MDKNYKILVIDDEEEIRKLLSFELGQQGYKVVTAANAGKGLERINQETFDLVISDIKMPGMDGVALLGKIKKINPDIEVIMATGYGTMDSVIESMRKGASDYINKPFNLEEVTIAVEKAINNKQLKETVSLYEIGKALFSTINLADLLKLIIDASIKILRADDVSLMLFDGEKKLHIAVSSGIDDEIKKKTRLEIGERIAGWVIENKKPICLVNGLKNDPRFKDIEGRREIKSSMVFPLMGKAKPLGVLNINRVNIERLFTDSDMRKLEIYASLVSMALENANLYNELQVSQEQLIQSGKMAGIGMLTSGIAHEFNNFLAIMRSNAEFAHKTEKPDEMKKSLSIVMNTCDRGKKIIENLIAFSRQETLQKEACNIENMMEIVLSLMDVQLKKSNISLVREYEKIPDIEVNRSEIQQVFFNVISNARDAMLPANEGVLTIRISTVNKNAVISFTDTGTGIKKENIKKIFEPFYTTKGPVGGSDIMGVGIGMSVSYGIVKRNGGEISVDSEFGRGTVFTVKFPAKGIQINEKNTDN